MKLRSLILAVLLAAFVIPVSAKKDPEDVHVEVILFSGDTIRGYLRNDVKTGLKNLFSKSGSIHQYINLGEEPKGGDTKRYSASDVKEYRFLVPTEAFPEGAAYVSEQINSPIPFKPNYSVRGFAFELDRRDSGSVLKWNVWESTGGRNSVSRLVPAIGVKLKGAKAAYAIIVNGNVRLANLLLYLKKKNPALKKVIEEYYEKGKDAKAHRKELLDNPSTFLTLYEKFLEDHEPLSDPDENKDLKD